VDKLPFSWHLRCVTHFYFQNKKQLFLCLTRVCIRIYVGSFHLFETSGYMQDGSLFIAGLQYQQMLGKAEQGSTSRSE
jgi:hypothetical protein